MTGVTDYLIGKALEVLRGAGPYVPAGYEDDPPCWHKRFVGDTDGTSTRKWCEDCGMEDR